MEPRDLTQFSDKARRVDVTGLWATVIECRSNTWRATWAPQAETHTERRSHLTAEAGGSSAGTFRQTSQCRYVDGGPRNPAPPILQIPIARCFGSGPARSHKSVCTMYTINLSFHQARGAGDERIGTRSCTEEHVFFAYRVPGASVVTAGE